VKLTSHLNQVLRSRMSGKDTSLLPSTSSWYTKGQFYLYFFCDINSPEDFNLQAVKWTKNLSEMLKILDIPQTMQYI
jgi:hypothetical protein